MDVLGRLGEQRGGAQRLARQRHRQHSSGFAIRICTGLIPLAVVARRSVVAARGLISSIFSGYRHTRSQYSSKHDGTVVLYYYCVVSTRNASVDLSCANSKLPRLPYNLSLQWSSQLIGSIGAQYPHLMYRYSPPAGAAGLSATQSPTVDSEPDCCIDYRLSSATAAHGPAVFPRPPRASVDDVTASPLQRQSARLPRYSVSAANVSDTDRPFVRSLHHASLTALVVVSSPPPHRGGLAQPRRSRHCSIAVRGEQDWRNRHCHHPSDHHLIPSTPPLARLACPLLFMSLPLLLYTALSVCALSALLGCAPVAAQCDGCVGGAWTALCPYPELCGLAPISCAGCASNASLSAADCPHPSWCVNVTCGAACMDSMPMPGCLDPGACGFKPTACSGCVVGHATKGTRTSSDRLCRRGGRTEEREGEGRASRDLLH